MRFRLFLLSLFAGGLFASGQKTDPSPDAEKSNPLSPLPSCFELQARIGGQYNIDETNRDIYGNWVPVYQLEASSGTWRHLYGWFNVGWSNNSGNTELLDTKTKYFLIPLAAGLKCAFPFSDRFFFYLGLGANYTYLHIHDFSSSVPSHTVKWNWRCTAKSGLRIALPSKRIFFEIVADYSYLPFRFSSSPDLQRPSIDMGGLLLGISFGGQPVVCQ